MRANSQQISSPFAAGLRILIADDHSGHADIVCALLEWMGHECRNATSRTAALDLASGMDPDIALIDISRPDIAGFEIARTIRLSAQYQPYLVAVAGWMHSEHRSRALDAGFDAYIVKPLDLTTLERIVSAPPPRSRVPSLTIVRR